MAGCNIVIRYRVTIFTADLLTKGFIMPVKTRGPLTEAMFYILMVLSRGNVCGTEIASSVAVITRGRVRLGPGTLYTLLAKFLDEGFVTEVGVEGRMRTYSITESGRAVYERELERLRTCLADASDAAERPGRDTADRSKGGLS